MGGKGREGEGEEKEERGKKGKGEGEGGGRKGSGEGCVMAFGGMDAPGTNSKADSGRCLSLTLLTIIQ